MNYLRSFLLVALTVGCLGIKVKAQTGVAINTTGSSADASAMLDVSSTSKGFLLPRLTTAQRDVISLPATGLSIYNTSINALQVNIGTPSSPIWSTLSTASAGWSLSGNSGTSTVSNFLGTTDNVGLALRTNNTERIMIDNAGRVGIGTSSPGSALHIVPASGVNPLTIMGVTLGTTASTDSILTISSGVVKKLPVSTFNTSTSYWGLSGNSGVTSSNFIGSTNNVALNFRTNNVQRMIIDITGKVGIGTTAPGTMLHVVAPVNSDPLTLLGVQTGSVNSTDSLLTISAGVVKKVPASTFELGSIDWGLSGNNGITSSNFLGTINNIGLNFRTNNIQRMTIDNSGNVGIGITSPTALLHIVAPSGSNPLNLTGVATGASTDSLLTIINGVVKKISPSALTPATTSWLVTGNSGLVDNSTNYLGTNDNVPVNFRAYGQKAGRIDAANTFFGAYSGNSNSNGSTLNTGIGWHALFTNTTGTRNTALGYGALQNNTGSDNIGIGYAAETNGTSNSIAIGSNAYITGSNGIAIGASSQAATNAYATAIGANSYANGTSSIAIGSGSGAAANKTQAQGATSIAVGFNAYSGATNNIAFGSNSNAPSGTSAIAIGTSAYSGNTNSVSIGTGSSTTANNTVAVGNGAAAYSASSTGIGDGAKGNATNATAIGAAATANNANSTAIGYNATVNANDAIVLGDANNSAVKVGIGTAIPGYKLHVLSTSNPLFLGGVQDGSSSDSLLTILNGVVKKLPYSTFSNPTTAWNLTGNAGTTIASNFLGTTDNVPLAFRTNNIERMRVGPTGEVAIGATSWDAINPEKLLVDLGTTTSHTMATFRGTINDYLQLNIQNKSNGSSASTDYIATADNGDENNYYVDLGINSSNYASGPDYFGGPNDAYLYAASRNLLIGTQAGSTDVYFLSGGGSLRNNAVLKLDGSTRNMILGRGENSNNAIGNVLRGPNAGGASNVGGDLTLRGGNSTGTALAGSVNILGGTPVSGTPGSVNINSNSNNPVNIGTGTNTQNVTIGGTSNNILFPKFPTVGGLIYTAAATGQIGSLTPGTSGYVLQSNGTGSAPSWVSAAGLNTNGWLLGGNSVSATQNLGTTTNYDLPFITNNTEKMRLTKAGYLGIGTANPSGTFHVVADNDEFGDDYFFEDYGAATTQGLYFRKARGTAAAPANLANGDLISWIRFAPRINGSFPFNNNAGFGVYYKGNGTTDLEDLRFYTSSVEQMRIDENGNVGINKTNPTEILDVAGNIRFSGALMPNNVAGTSGYVLKSNGTGTSPTWVDVNTLISASGLPWTLGGNSNATASSYLGTSNGQPLVFKVNGLQAGYLGLSGSSFATAFGVGSAAQFKSTAIGAGADANTGNEATAIGYNASASGFQSIAIGSSANTTATNQAIAIGYNSNSSSYLGIAIGANANASTSNQALAVGYNSNATGFQSSAFGNGASATGQNSMALGNGATVSAANSIAIGNTTISSIKGQVAFSTFSDGRFKTKIQTNVHGLDFIMQLRPVTYNWDIHKFNSFQNAGVRNVSYSPEEEAAMRAKESIRYTGFIAQEVEQAANKVGYDFSGVIKPQNDHDAYAVSYSDFVVPLVKAAQELNQKNEELTKKLEDQQQLLLQLMEEVKELKTKVKR